MSNFADMVKEIQLRIPIQEEKLEGILKKKAARFLNIAEKDMDEVLISAKNNQIQISSTKDRIHAVSLFALDGKQLFQTQQLKTKTHLIKTT